MTNMKIPAIPTKNVKFEKGVLSFEILEGCAYCPDHNGFTGGDWVKAHFKSEEGAPVFIKLDGGQLVITKIVNSAIDETTGYIVGGKRIEIARINVCE